MKKQLFLRLVCFSVFTLLGFCLAQEVNAATLSSYNHYYSNEYNGACGTSNKYTYSIIDSMGNWTYNSGTIGTVYSGKANAFWFDFNYDLTANTYYDIVINAPTNDFTQSITSSLVSIGNGTSCGDTNLNNISLVSVTKGASSGQYKKLTIRIFSATAVDYWTIGIENDSPITGVSTFGISSLSITEVDLSGTDIIVDNNNSNTESIIANQNQNNEELKESIDKNFNSCHTSYNLFPGWIIGKGLNANSGVLTTWADGAVSTDYIPVDFSTNPVYYLSGLSSNLRTFVAAYDSNNVFLGRTDVYTKTGFSFSENSFNYGIPQGSGTIAKLRVTSYILADGSTPITEINNVQTMLNVGDTALDYEEYGKEICANNLEEQVKTSKGILGTLKSVFTSIVELPKKIVDLLVDGLKSLFVPDSDEMNQLIDNFKETTSQKLGVIYQAGDLLIGIFQNIIDDSTPENACLTFPELKVPQVDQAIIEETDFCFNEITDKIPVLLTTIRGISGVFITLTFINMLKKKYDDFINGGEL